MKLYQLYYPADCYECCKIIEDYKLSRGHPLNPHENTGLEKLVEQIRKTLSQLKDDIYGEERLKIEAVTFLQHAIVFQYRPVVGWYNFYDELLKMFHYLGELPFKESIVRRRKFLAKKPCLYLRMLDDNTLVKYNSHPELIGDFGRYKADVLVRNMRKIDIKVPYEEGGNIETTLPEKTAKTLNLAEIMWLIL